MLYEKYIKEARAAYNSGPSSYDTAKSKANKALQYRKNDTDAKNIIAKVDSYYEMKRRNEESAWQQAKTDDDISSYQRYLNDYPKGKYVSSAQNALQQCRIREARRIEEECWQEALRSKEIYKVRDYVNKYPKGAHLVEANNRIDDYALWSQKRQIDTKAAYESYLNTSRTRSFRAEAEQRIKELEADEAWQQISNSESEADFRNFINHYGKYGHEDEAEARIADIQKKMAEQQWADAKTAHTRTAVNDYLTKYANKYGHKQEADNLIILFDAVDYYRRQSYNLSYENFHKVVGKVPFNDEENRMYREVEENHDYQAVQYSSSESQLLTYINRYPNGQYTDKIRNKVAVIKADRLNAYSSDNAFEDARQYAVDPSTRGYVDGKISLCKSEHRKLARREWWRGRFRVGLHVLGDYETEGEFCSFGGGLMFNFGRSTDIINFSFGASYVAHYWMNDDADEYESALEMVGGQVTVPAYLKFNLIRTGQHSRVYLGCGAEVGFKVNENSEWPGFMNTETTFAVIPTIGHRWSRADLGIYYKHYTKNVFLPELMDDKYCDRVGIEYTFYF